MVARSLLMIVLAAVAACAVAAPASAQGPQTFVVTEHADAPAVTPDGACPPPCTLRQAIEEANFVAGRDRIELPAGTYTLTGTGDDTNQSGDLDITEGVEIVGAGARATIIDGNLTDRVFDVDAGFTTIRGLTITRGFLATAPDGGGGLRNLGAETHLIDVAVRGNSFDTGQAGGLYSGSATLINPATAHLRLTRVLVQGNSARFGGGLVNSGGVVVIENSTFSGNVGTTAVGSQGGGAIENIGSAGTSLTINWSTFAGNQAPATYGTAINSPAIPAVQVRSTIFGDAGQSSCKPNGVQSHGGNVEHGATCGLTQPTDRMNADPLLGPSADNGGPTDTHLPAITSAAIDLGTGPCPPEDQRGVLRPFGPACDSGAVEVHFAPVPPAPIPSVIALDPAQADRRPGDDNVVTATVRNGDGSAAAHRSLRYEIDGPNEGAGTATTDAAGQARIAWEGVREGDDTLTVYVDTNENLTHESPAEPVAQARVHWSLPAPRVNRTLNIEPVSGIVRIREPASARRKGVQAAGGQTMRLTEGKTVPIGTIIDVRGGRVQMSTASNNSGGIQKGEFYGGVYQTVRQSGPSSRPVTEIRLTEQLVCRPNRRGKVAPARARSRRLWGNARGRYRTRGRHSAATVRGTIWLQKDTCTKTTTVVREGVVIVRDFAKRKNVRVKAGRRYVARQRARRR